MFFDRGQISFLHFYVCRIQELCFSQSTTFAIGDCYKTLSVALMLKKHIDTEHLFFPVISVTAVSNMYLTDRLEHVDASF